MPPKKARRHHTIPRFYLAGFSFPLPSGAPAVYFYRRGSSKCSKVNIDDASVQGDFYEATTVDDAEKALSVHETRFADLIARLRLKDSQPQVNERRQIASLVVHLAVRTELMRDLMNQLLERTPEIVAKAIPTSGFVAKNHSGGSKQVKKLLRRFDGTTGGQNIRAALGLPIKGKISRVPEEVTRTLMTMGANAAGMKSLDEFAGKMAGALEAALKAAPVVKRSHTDSLLCALDNPDGARVELYRKMNWRVERVEGNVVLGDVGPLAMWRGTGRLSRLFDERATDTAAIILPLAHDRLLVGSHERTVLNLASINQASAEHSVRIFVSRIDTPVERELHERIGVKRMVVDADAAMQAALHGGSSKRRT